ncbi:hypothetical protein FQA39_LY07149 [Lamprigera yunnana]|nr:hypothetical protein FQA39_LY07149 [Lamprigera yunnana]
MRKEKKKRDMSMKSGAGTDNVYSPKLWYLNLFNLLGDHHVPSTSLSNLDDEDGSEMDEVQYDGTQPHNVLKTHDFLNQQKRRAVSSRKSWKTGLDWTGGIPITVNTVRYNGFDKGFGDVKSTNLDYSYGMINYKGLRFPLRLITVWVSVPAKKHEQLLSSPESFSVVSESLNIDKSNLVLK